MQKNLQETLVKLIAILNDGQYHDGNSLGEALHITRSAVWKNIKKLQNYGLKIDSIKSKGYLLLDPVVLINPEKIKKNIDDLIDLHVFETIDSTNQYLKKIKSNKHIVICMAEQQTVGRGRFNREWYSPFGKNIYLSCLYPFKKDVSELAGLSLLTSLAVVRTLNDLGIENNLFVKWSNDVLFSGMKLAGNLIEVQAETHATCYAIIGIGLNVNMQYDAENKISQQWVSLKNIINHDVDRNDVCIRLINHLIHYLKKFEVHGFNVFQNEWDKVDYLKGKEIQLKIFNENVKGTVKGINSQGYLLLALPDGTVRVCSSGEASVVKGFV